MPVLLCSSLYGRFMLLAFTFFFWPELGSDVVSPMVHGATTSVHQDGIDGGALIKRCRGLMGRLARNCGVK